MLRARSVGYLVPDGFDGTIHSVFEHACNVAWRRSLLAILAVAGNADAPNAIVLDDDRVDLRALFDPGDPLVRSGDRLQSTRAGVDLANARVWRPQQPRAATSRAAIEANLRRATDRLSAHRDRLASVVHREGRAVCASLERACAAGDLDRARRDAAQLVGWGEGSTPAGDDFLIGLLAGLCAAPTSPAHEAFAAALSAAIAPHADRTTDIGAAALRLACQCHFGATLHDLRDALLSDADVARLCRLVDDALAVGATSGADTVAGLLAGLRASLGSEAASS